MGLYRFTFVATGGNGCDRTAVNGKVWGCGQRSCPDCEIREFVQRMRQKGQVVEIARLEHFPDTPQAVVDDLLTRKRDGSF